jgi:hypothetical protein
VTERVDQLARYTSRGLLVVYLAAAEYCADRGCKPCRKEADNYRAAIDLQLQRDDIARVDRREASR